MERMTVESFLAAPGDFEARQYRILQSLKAYHEEFSHSRLYPPLADLIELYQGMEALVQTREGFDRQTPRRLTGIDLKKRQLLFDSLNTTDPRLEETMDLIAWALPFVQQTIEEGTCIYNFVEERLSIGEVGLLPMYRDEGYWFVPEARNAMLHLVRYQVSLFTSGREQYRTLKTRIVESIEQLLVHRSPESIKLELIDKYHDLPNPATYVCETDLEFPFAETIFPVAKRKLITQIFS